MWDVDLTGCSCGRVGSEMKDKIRNNTRIAMQNPEVRLGVPILLTSLWFAHSHLSKSRECRFASACSRMRRSRGPKQE